MLGWSDPRPLSHVLPAKEARALAKNLGVNTVAELLEYYPRLYSRYGSGVSVAGAEEGEHVTCVGQVRRVQESYTRAGKLLTRVTLTDGTEELIATFFQSRWISQQLTPGTRGMFSGKLRYFRDVPQLQHPTYVLLGPIARQGTGEHVAEILEERDYLPIYPARKTLTSWRIMAAVEHTLAALPPIPESLDEVPADLVSLDAAVRGIHQPGPEGPQPHRFRLKYNEALALACVMALRRADASHREAPPSPPRAGGLHDALRAALPFDLTPGQEAVVTEISRDLSRRVPMSRLLQGEVGSGKTIVALLAMLQAVDSGHQCALLAPTEVLATQHARSLTETLLRAGIAASVVLLTGSMSTAARKEALLAVVSGQADIVVGTHAIIQDAVEFFRLGLVVVDEQHRFGVEQRDRLRLKGGNPHLLVMTATPIPRTIAMTVFGDLEVSTLRELPGGRRPIRTWIVPESKPAWVRRAWERIREEVAVGRQAYVVCPRIEGEGGVTEVAERILPELRVEVLHGKLPAADKEDVMRRFASGEIDVLVSTTVVEVGVDVPNATVMMIMEAERFGISQLHQLRGRVGRGGFSSLCFLVTESTPEDPGWARLEAVAATTDGFVLAQQDLRLRQEGDVLGEAQSGRNRQIRLLDLFEDQDVIERANRDAEVLVARNRAVAERIATDIAPDSQEFLEKS
ncbi:ATP-dependent DNA helicase RecG [Corynebacterium sp. zg-331]|uniref:ATP-dependent DNA helicase RecG n=1 Tax=unclassified Corynebacterium TaxID=2624378 RepID=UPI00128E89F5|nr:MULTISPECIES: ATP-dependent DNA helicase RecG [unclassified Corynebacterium]MBC3186266.1 ATP-dependent DNA helicase RecG [Corynebacterium sp. zg-331]MPV52753.1 DEAD/DEAH box helicase [Corynebacterium sp. zg331]